MDAPAWLTSLTPTGTLLLAVALILWGKLIPETVHNKIAKALEERALMAEARAEKSEEQRDKLQATLGGLGRSGSLFRRADAQRRLAVGPSFRRGAGFGCGLV